METLRAFLLLETHKVSETATKRKRTGGGSRKGIPNKATAEIKAMIEGALKDVGGQKYLALQAMENPSAFMALLGRILPKDINHAGANGGPITVQFIKEIVDTN